MPSSANPILQQLEAIVGTAGLVVGHKSTATDIVLSTKRMMDPDNILNPGKLFDL